MPTPPLMLPAAAVTLLNKKAYNYRNKSFIMYVCMYVYACVCMYVYICAYVCVYVCVRELTEIEWKKRLPIRVTGEALLL